MATYIVYFSLCCGVFLLGVGGHDCTDSRTGIGYPSPYRTVLRFFNDALAATSEHARGLWLLARTTA